MFFLQNAYWVVLLPLIAAWVIFFFGRFLPMRGALIGIAAIGTAFIQSLGIFAVVVSDPSRVFQMSLPWFRFGIYQTELSVFIDGLSATMLVVVTFVSLLVHIYSLSYMHDDPRFKRYYAYISFFSFAMLLLVVANNFLQMFIGWELMGVASYLLIGFWFEKTSAANAGRKAFITTRVGDLGFFLGILTIFALLGTFNFNQVAGRVAENLISPEMSALIALMLFCGAVGKSAQVPLQIWLPDAMEGPTPVSALIHAATMVAAGVYLVARSYFLFQHGAFAMEVVAWVGITTAFLAATMALVSNDIKRVLAFSTVSQLGYMILAMGVGGRTAGIFHLVTHAFFKALMFLGAGSVIHAMHTNDIQEMGGLSKKMIWTFWTFSFAWLAICGVYPFAGFFSKDAILEAAHHSGHLTIFWLAVFVAFLTAFYMTRLYALVFVTDPRNIDRFSHAHESPKAMVIPLVLLACLAFSSGILLHYVWPMEKILSTLVSLGGEGAHALASAPEAEEVPAWFVPGISTVAALGGILLAFGIYVKRIVSPDAIQETFQPIHRLLDKRYYFDEFYIYCFVKPGDALARFLYRFDSDIFDRWGVDGVGGVTVFLSKVQNWFDRWVIDGLVNIWGVIAQLFSIILRALQTGWVQNYILFLVLGFGALIVWRLKPLWCAVCHFF